MGNAAQYAAALIAAGLAKSRRRAWLAERLANAELALSTRAAADLGDVLRSMKPPYGWKPGRDGHLTERQRRDVLRLVKHRGRGPRPNLSLRAYLEHMAETWQALGRSVRLPYWCERQGRYCATEIATFCNGLLVETGREPIALNKFRRYLPKT